MGDIGFGRYRLERMLGKGGMGQVWLAYDTVAERRVALKLLPAELAADAGYRKRFEREAEIIAALRSPHVAAIHSHGEIDGRLFIDMAFIEGTDLGARLSTDGLIPPAVAVGIIGQVAAALDAAHRAGLVHRDVKPSNIVVRPDGAAFLIDFGVAHRTGQTAITATGFAMGTWAYMAPERFTGKTDARSDVYSLACVLYECVTGRRPYGDTDPAQQMHAHLLTEPPRAAVRNPAVPRELDEVIARGMAKHPDARYSAAGEFATAARIAVNRAAYPPAAVPPNPTKHLPDPGLPPTRVATHPPFDPSTRYPAPPRPTKVATRQSPPPYPATNRPGMRPARVETRASNRPNGAFPAGVPPTRIETRASNRRNATVQAGLPPTRIETRHAPAHALVRAERPVAPPNPRLWSPQPRQWYLWRRPAPAPVRGRRVFPTPERPQRRRRRSMASRVILWSLLLLLSPFLLAAGCAALVVLADPDGTAPAPQPPSPVAVVDSPPEEQPNPYAPIPQVTVPSLSLPWANR
ncbi:protein kinase [Nocardia sp. NPDC052566]|uniref:serine/threonine-protein kinase n=1 Tax=Nocardia sp. NPDC052566 TaxID=3364330 RepID=UPI0037CB3987